MKWFLRILAMIAVLGIAVVAAAAMLDTETRPAPDENPGYRTSEIEVPHRDVTLPVHIWYPAKADGTPALIGQNALFYGHYVHPDASPEAGPFPVVLISHGSGGNAVQLGWIARELALSGMIVVATNHPGTTSRDSDPFQTIKIWERPADLTALLDWTLAQPDLPADPAKVGVLGFSLGGHSALALSGARASKDKFVSYCASPIEGALDCDWMEAAGVDFTTIDAAAYEADLSDPRIGATVAIDPALPLATTPESLAAIAHPVLIANLGEQDSVPRAIRADGVADAIPGARFYTEPGAWHFSFLAECATLGRIIIGLSSPENICDEPAGLDRSDLHESLIAVIVPFMSEVLNSN